MIDFGYEPRDYKAPYDLLAFIKYREIPSVDDLIILINYLLINGNDLPDKKRIIYQDLIKYIDKYLELSLLQPYWDKNNKYLKYHPTRGEKVKIDIYKNFKKITKETKLKKDLNKLTKELERTIIYLNYSKKELEYLLENGRRKLKLKRFMYKHFVKSEKRKIIYCEEKIIILKNNIIKIKELLH